jgi:hypothetical protein
MAEDRADPRNWTADELTTAIANAIRLREFGVIETLLRLLAVKDAYQAQLVYETLKLGVAPADQESAG